MKKKLFILLFLLISFFSFSINSYALDTDIVEFIVNNYNFVGGSNILVYSGSTSYSLTVQINDMYLHGYYIIYFGTNVEQPSYMDISLSGGCNTSCFGSGYYLKKIGLVRGSYYYAAVLPRGKSDCGVGTGQCLISNIVNISSGTAFNMYVMGVDAVDDDSLINNSYQGFVDIVNSQNNNTQNIINNQNNNTQSIINNQNNNANQAHQDSQAINNTLNDDSIPTDNNTTANSWASQSASDSVVSDMVLMPITLLNAFSNGFNGTCQPYTLGSLYGTNLTLPCVNIQNYLGSTLWTIIDVLMSGFLIYGIGKKFVKVFNDFTNLKDSQVDELYGGGSE